jgi:hypothetical protein
MKNDMVEVTSQERVYFSFFDLLVDGQRMTGSSVTRSLSAFG